MPRRFQGLRIPLYVHKKVFPSSKPLQGVWRRTFPVRPNDDYMHLRGPHASQLNLCKHPSYGRVGVRVCRVCGNTRCDVIGQDLRAESSIRRARNNNMWRACTVCAARVYIILRVRRIVGSRKTMTFPVKVLHGYEGFVIAPRVQSAMGFTGRTHDTTTYSATATTISNH